MKKRARLFLLGILAVVITATSVVYAASTASGSFSLTYGHWDRTAKVKPQASYPYMKYTSQNASGGVVDATISKVTLFSFDNLQRVYNVSINGNGVVTYALFNSYSTSNNYQVTTVETASGGTANASYLFTSKSHSGNP